jgi:hypothetical protein
MDAAHLLSKNKSTGKKSTKILCHHINEVSLDIKKAKFRPTIM